MFESPQLCLDSRELHPGGTLTGSLLLPKPVGAAYVEVCGLKLLDTERAARHKHCFATLIQNLELPTSKSQTPNEVRFSVKIPTEFAGFSPSSEFRVRVVYTYRPGTDVPANATKALPLTLGASVEYVEPDSKPPPVFSDTNPKIVVDRDLAWPLQAVRTFGATLLAVLCGFVDESKNQKFEALDNGLYLTGSIATSKTA